METGVWEPSKSITISTRLFPARKGSGGKGRGGRTTGQCADRETLKCVAWDTHAPPIVGQSDFDLITVDTDISGRPEPMWFWQEGWSERSISGILWVRWALCD